ARTATRLAGELDPTAVLDEVAEHSLALLRVDACTISVLEDAELVVKAAAGGARDLVETRYPLGAHPAAEVVDAGAPVALAAAAERITGVPPVEALGRTVPQILQRELASATGTPIGLRNATIRRGNDEVTLSLTEAVMHDPAGAVAGRIFAFRDVSAEQLVEQMKSDFVSIISHGLRTPLTSIFGFAETLLRRDILFGEAERRTFLGYIASEAERLT